VKIPGLDFPFTDIGEFSVDDTLAFLPAYDSKFTTYSNLIGFNLLFNVGTVPTSFYKYAFSTSGYSYSLNNPQNQFYLPATSISSYFLRIPNADSVGNTIFVLNSTNGVDSTCSRYCGFALANCVGFTYKNNQCFFKDAYTNAIASPVFNH
jgi:hypothetical protein